MLKTGTYIIFYVLFADFAGGMFLPSRSSETILMDSTSFGFLFVQVVIFCSALFTLYNVQDEETGWDNKICYSESFKSKLLIKYVAIWLGIALSVDILFVIFIGLESWVDINPFDSWIIFCFTYLVYKFSSSLEVCFNYRSETMKCNRLGLITASIMEFESIVLSDNELVITSGDQGKYFFQLDRFTNTKREQLVSSAFRMVNKEPNGENVN
ncbi:hypothetical protein L1077_26185 [Pseudoalteromonas luteoviolacea]|uniref:hypothetical protein n=1 Tax=Pseudoalteromonas luteoviolacea TaxID=43657 RepID=UPI001F23A1BE|nr:hypothetical protein [Pseudoalteromonas luteoviolacea]MCF6442917.1 hypothetical protein [Pseudoalteromonas luteoviolacea]